MKTHRITSTALAAAFALGIAGVACAQGVDPAAPGSAAGGILAQGGPAAGGGTAPGVSMSEDQLRGILSARGYTDINGVERDGDHFKVGHARRYGRALEGLRVNARTGEVRDEPELNEEQARNLLEQRGYSDVRDVSRDGDIVIARARRDNREMNLRIDGNTGAVVPQPSAN